MPSSTKREHLAKTKCAGLFSRNVWYDNVGYV